MSELVSSLNTYTRSRAKGATAVMSTVRKRAPRFARPIAFASRTAIGELRGGGRPLILTVGLPLVPEPEVATAQTTKAAVASTTAQARRTLGRRVLGRVNVVAGAKSRRHRRRLG